MNELADVIEENQVKGVIADLMVETVNVPRPERIGYTIG